ncbi:MAG TPA: phosphopantetheine-binding protein [Anaerolineae bacterium]|nr:phosphopantetheine-binding protein [Anaerolineae bacterium]HMR68070.1 phosphopantetheine-binding protein [Anaerolineae bacterium]
MTTITATDAQIKETIFRELGKIAPEADFEGLDLKEDVRQVLDIDSFDFLNFLIALNEAYGVEIPEADYGRLVSVTDIVDYLQARLP